MTPRKPDRLCCDVWRQTKFDYENLFIFWKSPNLTWTLDSSIVSIMNLKIRCSTQNFHVQSSKLLWKRHVKNIGKFSKASNRGIALWWKTECHDWGNLHSFSELFNYQILLLYRTVSNIINYVHKSGEKLCFVY